MEDVIKRINELYRKAKTTGLTAEEKEEQDRLRKRYVEAFKTNLRDQLDSIRWVEDEKKE